MWHFKRSLATALLLIAAAVFLAGATEPAPRPSPRPTRKDQLQLPAFDYTASFVTPGGGGVLRAEETGRFRLELRNLEDRPIQDVTVSFKALGALAGLPSTFSLLIDELAAQSGRVVDLPVVATRDLEGGATDYLLEVVAEDGAYGPPARIGVLTRVFVAPRLDIIGVDILGAASGPRGRATPHEGPLRPGQRVVLEAQVRNLGGPAWDVTARFLSTDPLVTVTPTASLPLGDLSNGQVRKAAVEVAIALGYSGPPELPVWIEVSERHPDLGFRERLPMPLGPNVDLTHPATPSGRQ